MDTQSQQMQNFVHWYRLDPRVAKPFFSRWLLLNHITTILIWFNKCFQVYRTVHLLPELLHWSFEPDRTNTESETFSLLPWRMEIPSLDSCTCVKPCDAYARRTNWDQQKTLFGTLSESLEIAWARERTTEPDQPGRTSRRNRYREKERSGIFNYEVYTFPSTT